MHSISTLSSPWTVNNRQWIPMGISFACIKISITAWMHFDSVENEPSILNHLQCKSLCLPDSANQYVYQAIPIANWSLRNSEQVGTKSTSASHCLHEIPSWRHYLLNAPCMCIVFLSCIILCLILGIPSGHFSPLFVFDTWKLILFFNEIFFYHLCQVVERKHFGVFSRFGHTVFIPPDLPYCLGFGCYYPM
jgi:hypothetical protein